MNNSRTARSLYWPMYSMDFSSFTETSNPPPPGLCMHEAWPYWTASTQEASPKTYWASLEAWFLTIATLVAFSKLLSTNLASNYCMAAKVNWTSPIYSPSCTTTTALYSTLKTLGPLLVLFGGRPPTLITFLRNLLTLVVSIRTSRRLNSC